VWFFGVGQATFFAMIGYPHPSRENHRKNRVRTIPPKPAGERSSRAATMWSPAVATALGEAPAKSATASGDDPIFAAIEAHRKAVVDCFEARDKGDGIYTDAEAFDDTVEHELDVLAELLETVPTTFAGFVALFQRLSEPLPLWRQDHHR
jgi:hypothetical protein